uniref:Uncharacterized protein n=1 Tax=Aegilops tauschii subsp. strangulata TaxID=200361 RepID=A0A453QXR4_AEGTS
QDPEEQFGIVDTQYVVHHAVPTLRDQGNGEKQGSRAKVCRYVHLIFLYKY